jgi:rod shape-determining protein MreD
MSNLFLILATYVAAVLQISLAPAIEVRHVMPDLFALVAVLWLLRTSGRQALLGTAFVGLLYDLTSAAALGTGLGIYSVAGYALSRLCGKASGLLLPVQLVIVWLATTSIALAEAAAARIVADTTLSWTTLTARGVSVGVYTTALALPALMVIGWLPQRKQLST